MESIRPRFAKVYRGVKATFAAVWRPLVASRKGLFVVAEDNRAMQVSSESRVLQAVPENRTITL